MVSGLVTPFDLRPRRKRLGALWRCGCVGGYQRMVGLLRARIPSTIDLWMVGTFELRLDNQEFSDRLLFTMNKDLDTALMLIMGWIAFAMLVAAVNLVVVVGKLIFGA